ncbi:MAG: hypothetical protein V1802_00960 [Candidatus Aenigmatarchaeota archaeon]
MIERPEKIICENGVWKAEKGEKIKLPLKNKLTDGWAIKYFRGFPVETGSKKEAKKVWGKDRSYLSHTPIGLRGVFRYCDLGLELGGPFDVGADAVPDYWGPSVGVRSVSRHEPLRSKGDKAKYKCELTPVDYAKYLQFAEGLKNGTLSMNEIQKESEALYDLFKHMGKA